MHGSGIKVTMESGYKFRVPEYGNNVPDNNNSYGGLLYKKYIVQTRLNNFTISLAFDKEFDLYGAQGVAVVLEWPEQGADAHHTQLFWINKRGIALGLDERYQRKFRTSGTVSLRPLKMPAKGLSIWVSVRRGTVHMPQDSELREVDMPTWYQFLEMSERKIISESWFRPLPGTRGYPIIFQFENIMMSSIRKIAPRAKCDSSLTIDNDALRQIDEDSPPSGNNVAAKPSVPNTKHSESSFHPSAVGEGSGPHIGYKRSFEWRAYEESSPKRQKKEKARPMDVVDLTNKIEQPALSLDKSGKRPSHQQALSQQRGTEQSIIVPSSGPKKVAAKHPPKTWSSSSGKRAFVENEDEQDDDEVLKKPGKDQEVKQEADTENASERQQPTPAVSQTPKTAAPSTPAVEPQATKDGPTSAEQGHRDEGKESKETFEGGMDDDDEMLQLRLQEILVRQQIRKNQLQRKARQGQ